MLNVRSGAGYVLIHEVAEEIGEDAVICALKPYLYGYTHREWVIGLDSCAEVNKVMMRIPRAQVVPGSPALLAPRPGGPQRLQGVRRAQLRRPICPATPSRLARLPPLRLGLTCTSPASRVAPGQPRLHGRCSLPGRLLCRRSSPCTVPDQSSLNVIVELQSVVWAGLYAGPAAYAGLLVYSKPHVSPQVSQLDHASLLACKSLDTCLDKLEYKEWDCLEVVTFQTPAPRVGSAG